MAITTCIKSFKGCVQFFDDWVAQDPKRALLQATAFACNSLVLLTLIQTASSTFVFCTTPVIIVGLTLSTCLFIAYIRYLRAGQPDSPINIALNEITAQRTALLTTVKNTIR